MRNCNEAFRVLVQKYKEFIYYIYTRENILNNLTKLFNVTFIQILFNWLHYFIISFYITIIVYITQKEFTLCIWNTKTYKNLFEENETYM